VVYDFPSRYFKVRRPPAGFEMDQVGHPFTEISNFSLFPSMVGNQHQRGYMGRSQSAVTPSHFFFYDFIYLKCFKCFFPAFQHLRAFPLLRWMTQLLETMLLLGGAPCLSYKTPIRGRCSCSSNLSLSTERSTP
jgi:hypothetical protein